MNFIQRMMYGRYGGDQLGICLLITYVVLSFVASFTQLEFISWIGLALGAWTIYRMISRNLERRRAENARFLGLISPLTRWCKLWHTIHRDKDHRYFKCPKCGQQLRVPRGKGKVTVNCRSCGVSFEEKT